MFKYIGIGTLILLIGCTGPSTRTILDRAGATNKAPSCVRGCNQEYSMCVQNIGYGSSYSTDTKIVRCGEVLSLCVEYCPNK